MTIDGPRAGRKPMSSIGGYTRARGTTLTRAAKGGLMRWSLVCRCRRAVIQAALGVVVVALPMRGWTRDDAFTHTEHRPRCDHYDPLKQPFFGETHLHTAYSFDAVTLDTRNTPADAYRYAKGGIVGLPPWVDTRQQFVAETSFKLCKINYGKLLITRVPKVDNKWRVDVRRVTSANVEQHVPQIHHVAAQ